MGSRLRVAAIGTAWASQSPLPALASHEAVDLVAVCSARRERAAEAAARFGANDAFDDYRAMIETVAPDIVYVGGPVALHAPMVAAAVDSGAHVISEKPLAVDGTEARRLLDLVDRAGRQSAAAFTMRWFGGPATIKQLLADETIGEVRHVTVSYWFTIPTEVPRVHSWLNDLASGGGLLNAMGSHYLDLLAWWLGDLTITSGATRTWRGEMVDADGATTHVTADDAFSFSATTASGALVTMQASSEVAAPLGPQVQILGTTGSLVLDGLESVSLHRPGSAPQPVDLIDPIDDARAAACDSPRFGMVISRLVDAVDDGPRCVPGFADAVNVANAIDDVRRFADR